MNALTRARARTLALLIVVACILSPATVRAQELTDAQEAIETPVIVPIQAADSQPKLLARVQAWRQERGTLFDLYAGFAVLQVLDIHSTRRLLGQGGVELNPLIGAVAGHMAAFALVKAGATFLTLRSAERLRAQDSRAARILMTVLNGAYTVIVANNYRLGR